MRKHRLLVQDAWCEVWTAVNNREPLFRRRQAMAIFCRVFGEAHRRFVFELRRFRLEEEWLSFYIKLEDGLQQLPAIMQWVKQTFAVRFNRYGGGRSTSGKTGIGRGCWKGSRRKGQGRWIGRRWLWGL